MQLAFIYLDCRHEFLQAKKEYFIAEDVASGETVAIVSVSVLNEEWLWINDLWVAPEFHRRGVARALLGHLERETAGRDGIAGWAAGIDRENQASQQLFRSLGYRFCYSYDDKSRMFSKSYPAIGF